MSLAWRFAALAGLAAGLAVSPLVPAARVAPGVLAALGVVIVFARPRRATLRSAAALWLAPVAAVAALTGLTIGAERLAAIDSRALALPDGERVVARGVIVTTPRTSNRVTRFVLAVPGGRIGVQSDGGTAGADEGTVVTVRGTVRAPAPWEAGTLARQGAARIVLADTVRPTGSVRRGLSGTLDAIRRRAEAALERGTPNLPAALLRGFVLGQDDRIPEPVRDQFRRSGLAHVLAVSGQNVMLLALLATPILALGGVPIRSRLWWLIALIAIYVPVAGAGPSIQRAGIMGAAGLVAVLAGRPRARWYALLLAATATLALNPRATGDIGWQLSFAAVGGLLVLAGPITRIVAGPAPGPARRLLAEGAAMTLAATLATAPLAAHHFGTISLTAIPANLLALPAIAPAMWLGMLSGALGQITAAPVEPLTALGGLCAGYIGWVARAFGGEAAQLEIGEPSLGVTLGIVIGLLVGARLACLALARRVSLRARWRPPRGRPARVALPVATVAALALLLVAGGSRRSAPGEAPAALVIRILDVGQGDAILLQPRGAAPVLVDSGPPDGDAATRLSELGIDRIGALVLTHDQLDHAGGLGEVVRGLDVERLLFARAAAPAACREIACPAGRPVARGETIRAGRLRLDVLWPPDQAPPPEHDPNAGSLVLRARLGRFDALLTGDAEAEAAPIDPGPIDVLKVAHHGSEDPGLEALLARASPRLAVISVGAGNAYGHPAPGSLATLSESGVAVRRTDEAGEVVIEVQGDRWSVE